MSERLNLDGQKSGYWTALKRDGAKRSHYICQCQCGTIRSLYVSHFRMAIPSSCGCRTTEQRSASAKTHGMRRSTPYRIWAGIKQRCLNPNVRIFGHYGGRGIAICQEWMSFEGFWRDMGPTYRAGMSVERIDVDGNYEPANCKWIPRAEQARNTRKTVRLDSPWGRVTLIEAAELSGISKRILEHRVIRKWPAERMFEAPRASRYPKEKRKTDD